jgi:hypothetical protein
MDFLSWLYLLKSINCRLYHNIKKKKVGTNMKVSPKVVFYNCRLIPELDINGCLSTIKTPVAPISCSNHKSYIVDRVQSLIKDSMLGLHKINALIETKLMADTYADNPIDNIRNSDQFSALMINVREMWDDVNLEVIAQDFDDLQKATMGGKLLDIDRTVLPFLCLNRGYKELVQTFESETLESYLDKLGEYTDH